MKSKISISRYLLLVFLAGMVLAASAANLTGHADAQSGPPQILMTWQASTYAPDGFTGKIMPASDSQITVGVDLIDLGKHVDLSSYKIYWYIDDKFYQGATGLARIKFTTPHFIGNTSIRVRALITSYPSGPGKTILIPMVVPEAVIQSSAPSLSAKEAPFNVQAYPYFFNISDPSELNYSWSLNGTLVSNQNPFVATAEMADKGRATLELSIKNPNRTIERTIKELTIFNN